MKKLIKYGGAITGLEEERAIIRSIKNSRKTGNWQQAEEGKKFEHELSTFLGVKHSILTNSGSSAGLLALSALELPRGSEVIISAVTFPTIFNIILQCGLVPVVVDAKVGTYNFAVDDVAKAITSKTGAIMAIHALGNPVDMPRLMKLVKSKKQKIYVIEDNCDGWGSSIGDKRVGAFGDVSFTSFHAAHIVSMGVGGGVFTDSNEIARKVRMYRDWGRLADLGSTEKFGLPEDYPARFIYEKIGYNFQILELQAAMGRVQLKKLNLTKKLRQKNHRYLCANLNKHPYLLLPYPIEGADVCWFALGITVLPGRVGERGLLLKFLEERGIETRTMFAGNITKHPAYKDSKYRISGDLGEANFILENSFWISCHPKLTKDDLNRIVKAFDDYYALFT